MFRTHITTVLLITCTMFAGSLLAQNNMVTINGKAYTVHQVLLGETFYSIAQSYRVQVDSLRSVNRLADETASIHPGDMLIVPLYAGKSDAAAIFVAPSAPAVNTPPVTTSVVAPTVNGGFIKHTVITGETLYSVARQYPHTNVAAIKAANKLEVESLSIGQVLLIPSGSAIAPSAPATKPNTPPAGKSPVDTNAIYTPNKPSGSVVPAIDSSQSTVMDEEENGAVTVASFDMNMLLDLEGKYKSSIAGGKVEATKGTAIWITDSSHENQYRFYAMHKSAPIGSVVMVRNLMNDRVVYAKVIGKLPNNKSNENIVVKLSAGAARYLNVLDDRFVVELSLPQAKL